ncbi:MAG: hypothetical protein Q8918_17460 [Bacteroidota bacterium]|nr:hypothetical protein [Bacteroidota bacterium]MDP4251891.1 hypothetical protein [Bacteroidota bacterium]
MKYVINLCKDNTMPTNQQVNSTVTGPDNPSPKPPPEMPPVEPAPVPPVTDPVPTPPPVRAGIFYA